jgi:hypothetical protein
MHGNASLSAAPYTERCRTPQVADANYYDDYIIELGGSAEFPYTYPFPNPVELAPFSERSATGRVVIPAESHIVLPFQVRADFGCHCSVRILRCVGCSYQRRQAHYSVQAEDHSQICKSKLPATSSEFPLSSAEEEQRGDRGEFGGEQGHAGAVVPTGAQPHWAPNPFVPVDLKTEFKRRMLNRYRAQVITMVDSDVYVGGWFKGFDEFHFGIEGVDEVPAAYSRH